MDFFAVTFLANQGLRFASTLAAMGRTFGPLGEHGSSLCFDPGTGRTFGLLDKSGLVPAGGGSVARLGSSRFAASLASGG
jgi:hypothetical protein